MHFEYHVVFFFANTHTQTHTQTLPHCKHIQQLHNDTLYRTPFDKEVTQEAIDCSHCRHLHTTVLLKKKKTLLNGKLFKCEIEIFTATVNSFVFGSQAQF